MWLGSWLIFLCVLSIGGYASNISSSDGNITSLAKFLLNMFIYILGIGLTGGFGGLLFESCYPSNSSRQRLGCMPALFWGAFWSIVYAIWFYGVVIPGSTYGVNSYWGLAMLILAPIIPIYTSVGGLVSTIGKKNNL
jgi:hypothetical protein